MHAVVPTYMLTSRLVYPLHVVLVAVTTGPAHIQHAQQRPIVTVHKRKHLEKGPLDRRGDGATKADAKGRSVPMLKAAQ